VPHEFGGIVYHQAKLRKSLVTTFAAVPMLIVVTLALYSFFTIVLPMPVVEAIQFIPVDIKLPAPPPPPRTVANPPTGRQPSGPPLEPPTGIPPERPVVTTPNSPAGEIPGVNNVPTGIFKNEPPPGPPPAPPAVAPKEIPRIGGDLKPPTRIKNVNPLYPPIAQSARVQGVVIIEATIDVNGKVVDAKILRSIPLLDAAAINAVRQWEFTKPMLNERPTPVIMTVTVNFVLQ
jgi:protein TonB